MNKRLLLLAEKALEVLSKEHPDRVDIIDPLKDVISWQREYSEVVVFFNTELELIDPQSPHDLVEEDFANMFGAINEVGLEMKNGEVIRILLYMDSFNKKAILGVKDKWTNDQASSEDNFTIGTGELKITEVSGE